MPETTDIIFDEVGNAKSKKMGRIILNRPRALNAISYEMFSLLEKQLLRWRDDDQIKAILIKSNSEKAFCAGGDIRAVYDNKEKSIEEKIRYFQLEYHINSVIYHYPKPYISFLNGITMGGGAGISVHGSHSIGTERLQFAMPETLIGLFPDVGMSYYFSRLPNFIGIFLGLTGKTIDINDAVNLNLIKHHVVSDRLDALETELISTPFSSSDHQLITDLITHYQTPVKMGDIQSHQKDIASHFQFGTVEKIISSLQNDDAWAKQIADVLLQRSPTSLKVTLRQLTDAKLKNFDEVMQTDLCMVREFLQSHDFMEGIRAAVIDKDKQPQWRPNTLAGVDEEIINSYF